MTTVGGGRDVTKGEFSVADAWEGVGAALGHHRGIPSAVSISPPPATSFGGESDSSLKVTRFGPEKYNKKCCSKAISDIVRRVLQVT